MSTSSSQLFPAVFLDRDGTVIIDKNYLSDPDGVELIPGTAEAIKKLNAAGYLCVIITNQSGIGRGYFTEEDYNAVHQQMLTLLHEQGATLHAAYHCPLTPLKGESGNEIEQHLRKPSPGMLQLAAQEHPIDLSSSFMVGDRPSDIIAGHRAGCQTQFLIQSDFSNTPASLEDINYQTVSDLKQVAEIILSPS